MSKQDIDKAYVSPYDRFLYEFDSKHPKSASQLKEMIKYKRIAYLRDHVLEGEIVEQIWEEF